jgi:hypothetical protein
MVAAPVLPPKQLTFVVLVIAAFNTQHGLATVAVAVVVQLLASTTVTV